MKKVIINEDILKLIVREMLSEGQLLIDEAKKARPPKTVEKAILKANRDMDIEDHGKPTAFRTTITKNPKAYTRKEKHKGNLPTD